MPFIVFLSGWPAERHNMAECYYLLHVESRCSDGWGDWEEVLRGNHEARCIYKVVGESAEKVAETVCKALQSEYNRRHARPFFRSRAKSKCEPPDVARYEVRIRELMERRESSGRADDRDDDGRDAAYHRHAKKLEAAVRGRPDETLAEVEKDLRIAGETGHDEKTDSAGLSPSRRAAYELYEFALSIEPDLATKLDEDVFDWLVNRSDLPVQVPKKFATFRRYLSEARAYYGEQKHESRSGRSKGSSVVDADRI